MSKPELDDDDGSGGDVDGDDRPRAYNTLRGALRGWEDADEPVYFAHSASLRIFGDGLPLDEITARLGVSPTHAHRKGERRRPTSPGYREDAWLFRAPVPNAEPLARHVDALWAVVRPHVEHLKGLKRRYRVDVFCGYRSNCDHAGFEVPHGSLELFTALEVPFGVSVIIA
jgi:hypothetical protein